MRNGMIAAGAVVVGAIVAGVVSAQVGQPAKAPAAETQDAAKGKTMRLGNFSISLAVKDLAASRAFYEKLGFRVVGGNAKNFAIMQNDDATIGLFQGMFEKNSLTFNPGWDRDSKQLAEFTDVRDLQKALGEKGLTPTVKADESSTGPAFFMVMDPDGNPVLFDQHVAKPTK